AGRACRTVTARAVAGPVAPRAAPAPTHTPDTRRWGSRGRAAPDTAPTDTPTAGWTAVAAERRSTRNRTTTPAARSCATTLAAPRTDRPADAAAAEDRSVAWSPTLFSPAPPSRAAEGGPGPSVATATLRPEAALWKRAVASHRPGQHPRRRPVAPRIGFPYARIPWCRPCRFRTEESRQGPSGAGGPRGRRLRRPRIRRARRLPRL